MASMRMRWNKLFFSHRSYHSPIMIFYPICLHNTLSVVHTTTIGSSLKESSQSINNGPSHRDNLHVQLFEAPPKKSSLQSLSFLSVFNCKRNRNGTPIAYTPKHKEEAPKALSQAAFVRPGHDQARSVTFRVPTAKQHARAHTPHRLEAVLCCVFRVSSGVFSRAFPVLHCCLFRPAVYTSILPSPAASVAVRVTCKGGTQKEEPRAYGPRLDWRGSRMQSLTINRSHDHTHTCAFGSAVSTIPRCGFVFLFLLFTVRAVCYVVGDCLCTLR